MALSLGMSAVSYGTRILADKVCKAGVFSCSFGEAIQATTGTFPPDFSARTCAEYDGLYFDPQHNYAILVITALFAALMAFAIGGNDGANAWGTVIHSFAIRFQPAVILGTIFEVLGATTIGYGVSGSIQTGITKLQNPDCFACGYCNSSMTLYYMGMMAALISASIFILAATMLKMPVSTSHTIVSSVFGMTVVFGGFGCADFGFDNLGGVIASWFISPLAAGVITVIVYHFLQRFIFQARNPRERAYVIVPVLYFLVMFVIVMISYLKAPVLEHKPRWQGVAVGLAGGVLMMLIYLFMIFPRLRDNLPSLSSANRIGADVMDFDDVEQYTANNDDMDLKAVNGDGFLDAEVERPSLVLLDEYDALTPDQQDAMYLFKHLLVLVACLQSFSHGSNDTANATAALSAVINGFKHGINDCADPESPWWIMLIGGLFIGLGIWVIGQKVMDTIGKNISVVTFDRAFATEFSSAITVVVCSLLDVNVSTTHCQVGAVIFISMAAKESDMIQWKLVCFILLSWLLTLPLSAGLAALIAYVLKFSVKM
ncbi:hypothetical protein Poli38472_001272 [Pythium oligandrum]|uniref:Phosphate transporter n=1 Tax=Pythium oligandrum TaxID=41045 RepID=A0A8K1CUZ2_PYTOL|nr:hypothetical protein Poli38472_001272 [Pythium oligandrum]|eukprot:TMW69116.1 hypothetical protein Poli38472_001272 [Pythium oligandrum]